MLSKAVFAVTALAIVVLCLPVYDQVVPIGEHGDPVEVSLNSYGVTYDFEVKSYHTHLPLIRMGLPFDMYRFSQPDSCIRSFVDSVKADTGFKDSLLAMRLMEICEGIEYVPDSESHGRFECWQLPCETLRLGKGDCEDITFLYIAMCKAAGFDCVLAYGRSHTSAGVMLDYPGNKVEYGGQKYLIVDPTEQKFGTRQQDTIMIMDDEWGKEQCIFFSVSLALLAFLFVMIIRMR